MPKIKLGGGEEEPTINKFYKLLTGNEEIRIWARRSFRVTNPHQQPYINIVHVSKCFNQIPNIVSKFQYA